MAKTLSSLGFAILLCGVGRLAFTEWNNTLLTRLLLGLGGVLLLGALVVRLKRNHVAAKRSPKTIQQEAHGNHAPNITAIDGSTVNFTFAVGKSDPDDGPHVSALPQDCPQIVIGYANEPLYKGFNAINRGTQDAIGLHLRPVESKNYRLTSDTIQHLQPSSSVRTPLVLQAEHKTKGTHLTGNSAWNEFAEDVWMEKFPFKIADPKDDEAIVQMLNKVHKDMTSNQLVLELHVDYGDLRGKRYQSSANIAWGHFGENTKEVRPGPVRLRQEQEA